MINLIKLHYLLFELHSTRPKLTYKTGIRYWTVSHHAQILCLDFIKYYCTSHLSYPFSTIKPVLNFVFYMRRMHSKQWIMRHFSWLSIVLNAFGIWKMRRLEQALLIIRKYNELNHRGRAQIYINLDKNIII
jgi:hypothetical protein